MPKVYKVLPPPREDLDEILAFIYVGPSTPTAEDYKRTPFLIRRNKVAAALEWLKLNHIDYEDIDISYDNLDKYPEDEPPVVVDFHKNETGSNRDPEAIAVNDNEEEEGTEEDDCPFVVHNLTTEQYNDWLTKEKHAKVKAKALQHFKAGNKVLAIGHSDKPESLYNNPQLYPQMFPWLFPYGYGGLGNARGSSPISDAKRKRQLLMYYDKRFQLDRSFALIAFNHEQIKNSSTGGFLLTKRKDITAVADRLLNLNTGALDNLINRMQKSEEYVKPQTSEEQECYDLLKDLDYVNSHVDGSITNRKQMRSEIWALTSYLGAPSWFITFAPADVNHPIALYFADTNQKIMPTFKTRDDRLRLIAQNPVAGARFFKMMSELFIKHVLGVKSGHRGIYGNTAGYYGTVEQQGRLTLHMHMLIWIKNALTPQEIRERILDPKSEFQQRMVEYLESVRVGEFLTGTMSEVNDNIKDAEALDPDRVSPTLTLPTPPPDLCGTSIKAVTSYVTDYITKQSLKTHTIFEAVRTILSRNSDILTDDTDKQVKARKLITKVVNALTGKSEIGGPMAAMYLLKHPDHYTPFKFRKFYWYNFVSKVESYWHKGLKERAFNQKQPDEKILLWEKDAEYFGVSMVEDYMYRPTELTDMSLYDWVRLATKSTIPRKLSEKLINGEEHAVKFIISHQWKGKRVKFHVQWHAGDTTWESYTACSHLHAMDVYLQHYNVKKWKDLPQVAIDVSALNEAAYKDVADENDQEELDDIDLDDDEEDKDDNTSDTKCQLNVKTEKINLVNSGISRY
ncbi:hypothetical protein EIP86_000788 [Pleurotus ostreatoroseus]|nr:hypothetical protein EIP86_000788 [Pleurotus ostreatoroseus]